MQEKQSDFLRLAVRLAKESASILKRMQPRAKIAVNKGAGDFALNADITSEKHIIAGIRKHFPHQDILAEESGHSHSTSDYLWVIDPLEGTLNYAHGLPLWAVNIGLFYKGEPLVGVIYAPVLNELFYASCGKGTFLNGKRIHVSHETDLVKSFFSGSVRHLASINLPRNTLRALGCCGLELAYVACGRFGGRIKLRGNDPYGYGAAACIIKEADGMITDAIGKPWTLKSDGCLASNCVLHKKLIEIMAAVGKTS